MLTTSPLAAAPFAHPERLARVTRGLFAAITIPGFPLALYGLVMIGLGLLDARSPAHFFACLGVLAFIGLGLAQAAFYWRRLAGPVAEARAWWLSTTLYNLALAVVAGVAAAQAETPLAALPALAYVGLAALADHARRHEPAAGRQRDAAA